ncbi:MAG: hypothetical protein ACTJHU_00845 [Mycetocola sp.]
MRPAFVVARSERGGATAELGIVLPTVVLLIAVLLGVSRVSLDRVLIGSTAVDAVRMSARGDEKGQSAVLAASLPGSRAEQTEHEGGIVCVTVAAPSRLLGDISVPVTARACSLSEEGE